MSYKTGDKVLVEAEIMFEHEYTGEYTVRISETAHKQITINPVAIHSLAPEFKHQDRVEVRNSSFEGWDGPVAYICFNKVTSNHVVFDPKSMTYVTVQYARKIPQPDDTMIWKDGKRYKLVEVKGE